MAVHTFEVKKLGNATKFGILDKIIGILRDEAFLDDDVSINEGSRLKEDLEIDESFGFSIGLELETAFDVRLSHDFIEQAETVNDLVGIIEKSFAEDKRLTTIEHDKHDQAHSDIQWLIDSDDLFRTSALAAWPERHKSAALSKFARLRKAYPHYLEKATKYLFSTAAVGYEQTETFIKQSEVEAKIVDRTASMLGGFPWTDDRHPWPSFARPDGQIFWATPVLQLNLKTLSHKLGIQLPNTLLQFWDSFEPIEIPLADLVDADGSLAHDPNWNRPTQNEEPPVGWDHEDTSNVGSYISVGSPEFCLPSMDSFVDGSTTYYDEYIFQGEDNWKDISEWREMRPSLDGEDSVFEELENAAYEAFSALRPKRTHFLGVPLRTEISYEEWMKDGYRLLYTASGEGLNIWDGGYLMILYRLRYGKFEFAVPMGS